MKRIFNGNARPLAMDMPDVHHIAIYDDLIAAKVQGRTRPAVAPPHGRHRDPRPPPGMHPETGTSATRDAGRTPLINHGTIDECFS